MNGGEIFNFTSEAVPLLVADVLKLNSLNQDEINLFVFHQANKYMFALTDSGGIQEETTYLNIPCLTVRPNTERPVTVWEGSNKLIKLEEIFGEVKLILSGNGKAGTRPKYWDGDTAKRIVKLLENF